MEDPRAIANRDETQRIVEATRQATSELHEQSAHARQTIEESREILRLIAKSSITGLSSEPSDP